MDAARYLRNKLSYCGETVRAYDPDRFLLSMFAPSAAREALWALFALNLEIAKTREVVSETQLGLIRLQWWREAVGAIYEGGRVPEHEVLKPLSQAIAAHELPRDFFETLIYAREFDLEDVQPANLEGLLNYADFTTTPLMKLAVKIAGGDPDTEPVHTAAVNYALAGILRAVPFHAGQGRCLLPEDLLKKEELAPNRIYGMKPEDRETREKIARIAREIGGQIVRDVRPQNRLLRAAQILAGIYARQLRGVRYDLFHPRLTLRPAFRELRLLLGVRGE